MHEFVWRLILIIHFPTLWKFAWALLHGFNSWTMRLYLLDAGFVVSMGTYYANAPRINILHNQRPLCQPLRMTRVRPICQKVPLWIRRVLSQWRHVIRERGKRELGRIDKVMAPLIGLMFYKIWYMRKVYLLRYPQVMGPFLDPNQRKMGF